MASLELIPDPELIIVQGGLFLTSIYVVNKLFVAPFLRLHDARQEVTSVKQTKTENLIKECAVRKTKLEQELKDARLLCSQQKAESRKHALERVEKQINQAKQNATQAIKNTALEVRKELEGQNILLDKMVFAVAENLKEKLFAQGK